MTSGSNNTQQDRPTILITGASGLIGTRIAGAVGENYRLVGLDVEPPESGVPIEHISTDLTDDDSVAESLREAKDKAGSRIASVLHLAAYYDFTGEPSPMYDKLTVEGTRRLLRGLHDQNFEVEQFVFSSSMLVMEPSEHGHQLTELSPTRAEWDYPRSKLEAEQVIRDERGRIPTVVLRIAGVYDEQCHSLPLSQQIVRIYENQAESHVFPGDKSAGQSLIHLDDLAACFQAVVEHRHKLDGESLFLIGEPDVMSYGELQDRIGELIHGKEWSTFRIPKVVAKAGAWAKDRLAGDDDKPFIKPWMIDLADDHYAVSVHHAQTKLGWKPQHRLRDVLPEIIGFLNGHPQKFYEVNGLPIPESVGS